MWVRFSRNWSNLTYVDYSRVAYMRHAVNCEYFVKEDELNPSPVA